MIRNVNFFDKIGSLIPGYSGYAERDSRRNCDKLLREALSSKLSENESMVIKLINKSIKDSNRQLMRELESIRKEINTTYSKIKFSPYGVSSFFSDDQIKEDELAEIYKFDLNLSKEIDDFSSNLLSYKNDQLSISLAKINDLLNLRNQFIKNHK
tara:strand:+ start:2458 stop:2922 length:465 start_codon:yes stop_codon:yes gene_type:complete